MLPLCRFIGTLIIGEYLVSCFINGKGTIIKSKHIIKMLKYELESKRYKQP